jgi:protease YdgD
LLQKTVITDHAWFSCWPVKIIPLGIAATICGVLIGKPVCAEGLAGIGANDPRVSVDGNAPPWTAVARLQIPGIDRCTAFLIAPRIAVTAAHCLWGARLDHYVPPQAVHVVSGYRSGIYAAQTVAATYRIGAGYDPKRPYATLGSDVAVLTLENGIGGLDAMLRLAERSESPSVRVTLGGYSQDRAEVILADRNCHITASTQDEQGALLLRHTCTATHGTSGAPVLERNEHGVWVTVGVQVAATLGGSGGIAVPASAIRAVLSKLAWSR